MKYNIVTNDGEQESVTVFLNGETLIATKDHPQFGQILTTLQGWEGFSSPREARLTGLFDLAVPLAQNFTRLSERVTFRNGQVYFDGVVQHGALVEAICRYYTESSDFMALVNFMEKIATNPLDHSRDQLFTWLQRHKFSIAPDGDFLAYKGLDTDGYSTNRGMAIVNGTLVNGRIPNKPGTIIEMPRDQVNHNPSEGCSTGLHVASWNFAKGWSQTTVLVKVNPRDVVSVPTDSGYEKMRVCRYRVVSPVTQETPSMVWLGHEKTAPADLPDKPRKNKRRGKAAKKAEQHVFPEFFEQFRTADFRLCSYNELRWLAREWEVQAKEQNKEGYVRALVPAARKRLRTWGKS